MFQEAKWKIKKAKTTFYPHLPTSGWFVGLEVSVQSSGRRRAYSGLSGALGRNGGRCGRNAGRERSNADRWFLL